MYSSLIRAFNYALDRLSRFEVSGLPDFQEQRQIVFTRGDAKCIESESRLQDSYKPDIVPVRWNVYKRTHQYAGAAYSSSYEEDICCESVCERPSLSWRNLLSTIEVKRDSAGGAGNSGKKLSKGKAVEKLVKSTYVGGLGDLQREFEAVGPPEPLRPVSFILVDKENSTRNRMCTALQRPLPSHQLQLVQALASEIRGPRPRFRIDHFHHDTRGAEICRLPPEGPRRSSKAGATQNLAGLAKRKQRRWTSREWRSRTSQR